MNLVCLHCRKSFEGKTEKFCSQDCFNSHVSDIARRTAKAVREDVGHTDSLSKK